MLYAVLMYPLAYFYLRGVMFPQSYPGWGMPVFAALFIVYVDCAARAAHRTAAKETPLWAACWMALAAAYPLYGYQPGAAGRLAVDGMASVRRLVCAGTVRDAGAGAERQSGPAGRAGRIRPPAVREFLSAGAYRLCCAAHPSAGPHGDTKSSAPHRYRSGDAGAVRCGMGPAGSGRCQLCRAGAAGVRLVEQAAEQYEIH